MRCFSTDAEMEFSEVPHRTGPMQQGFLCIVSEVCGSMYIRFLIIPLGRYYVPSRVGFPGSGDRVVELSP
jgi:hypothetical protein